MGPALSIVICAYGRPTRLARLLAGLAAQTRTPEGAFEIVVADNHPEGLNREVVASIEPSGPAVRYVHAPEGGKTAAFAEAFACARGSLLHMIDEDHEVPQDYVANILHVFEDPTTVAVTGRIEIPKGLARVTVKEDLERFVFHDPRQFGEVGHGSNLTLRRDIFERIGLYDCTLGPGTWAGCAEDTDLLYRILRAGIPIHYEPAIRNEHHHDRPMDQEDAVQDLYYKGRVSFAVKHLLRGDAIPTKVLLRHQLHLIRIAVGLGMQGELRQALRIVRRLVSTPIPMFRRLFQTIRSVENSGT